MPAPKKKKSAADGAKSVGKKTKKSRPKTKPAVNTEPAWTPDEKDYVVINEVDPKLVGRYRLTWLVVALITLAIVFFWFSVLRARIGEAFKNRSNTDLMQELNQALSEFQQVIKSTENTTTADKAESVDVEQVKQDILSQLEASLDVSNWPAYSSEGLGLELKFPATWYKKEMGDSLNLTSYNASTTTPEILGQMVITKNSNIGGLKLAEWLKLNQPSSSEYLMEENPGLILDQQPVIKYSKKNTEETDLAYLWYVSYKKNVYEISVYSRQGRELYEPVFEQILDSIKFIK